MLSRIKNYLFGKQDTTMPSGQEISADCSLQDACLSGWFQNETNELFTGFDIKPEHHVLDVGCGEGGNSNFCANQRAEITFVDIDPLMVNSTLERLKNSKARALHGLVSNSAPLALSDNKFDRIVCTEVIEHVENPVIFIQELVRVGKPGALYLLSVPDPLSEEVQKKVAPALYFEKPFHINIFSNDDFSKLITDAGLVIEKRSSYGFYWSIFWSFFWTCNQDLNSPLHPLLKYWNSTWETLLKMPDGEKIKKALDDAMPKSQIIIARKPQNELALNNHGHRNV
ncbi:methyltransferase domain-containing protein [Venatoribacter cucullus]|uniref:Methyltransferase domain-containing protein n=1 Tax=Venatoribacter cucullus TaxID=2661630 RepID=A0A9X7UU53_9GAMM|nr:class I SAM-dependent methyltransferase [Venatoribacter cucullus]QQD23732.1 methyltransferase domain-containing protein [Venatoribacter cucullus]